MASRRGRGRRGANKPEDEPTQDGTTPDAVEEPSADAADAAEDAQTQAVEVAPVEFDKAASERALVACSGIYSSSTTAVTEAMDAASVFLNFGQKARIRALSVDFETRRLAMAAPATATASAAAPVQAAAAVQHGLDQEAVERIVSHRVDLAVQQALQALGVSPGQTLQSELDKQVAGQEQRLLDYLKRHLTDSLDMIEASVDDRIAELLDGEDANRDDEERTRAEVDQQVEAAKEELEKSISEVRDVEMGFNLSEFMDGVAGMVAADSSAGGDEAIEIAGDSLEVEAPEIELGGDSIELEGEEVELGGDDADEVEVAAEPDPQELLAQEIDEDLAEVVADVRELAEVDPDISSGAAAFVDLPMEAEEIELGGEELELGEDEAEEEAVAETIELADDAVEIQADEIQLADDDSKPAEIELDGDSVAEIELDTSELSAVDGEDGPVELDLGSEDIELVEDSDNAAASIERYLQRAAEMRERGQSAAALELYNKVLDEDSENYEALIGKGVLHLENKDYKRAIDQFSKAEGVDPSRPASSLGLAEVHFHRKQFNKAIRHYTQTLKLDDTLAQAYCNRGLGYYYQKNYKKAFLDLMRAYDIDPELPNIKKYLKLVRNKVKTDS